MQVLHEPPPPPQCALFLKLLIDRIPFSLLLCSENFMKCSGSVWGHKLYITTALAVILWCVSNIFEVTSSSVSDVISSSSLESYWSLFSTHVGKQIRHTGDLVEKKRDFSSVRLPTRCVTWTQTWFRHNIAGLYWKIVQTSRLIIETRIYGTCNQEHNFFSKHHATKKYWGVEV